MNVVPITEKDVPRAAAFLHEHLNADVPTDAWAKSFETPWTCERPNCGFMLTAGDAVGGVYAAYYSEREIRGRTERFCNLGAWCVLPEHRLQGLRLLMTMLAQPGYHFTDLSPSGNVVPMNERLGFKFLDTTTWLVPNLPWPNIRGRVVAGDAEIAAALTGRDLRVYLDHRGAPAARHVLLVRDGRRCHVMFRMDRRKGLPRVFASILHASDPEVFHRMIRPLARHLLLRHGAVATLAEAHVVKRRPAMSVNVKSNRLKMYLSKTLGPEDVDDLYSELTLVSW
jgi:hypothetical protein